MKAVVYDAPEQYEVRDIPMPEVGPGEVRIAVIQVGVCGTDLHIHHGDFNAAFPLIPGHELVGTVEAIGEGVTRAPSASRSRSTRMSTAAIATIAWPAVSSTAPT